MAKRRKPYLSADDRTLHPSVVPFGLKLGTRMVVNPLSDTGARITVNVPLKSNDNESRDAYQPRNCNPIEDMYARKQITDCQFHTAEHVQGLFEQASGIRSPDYSKPPVSGGGQDRLPVSDRQLKAYNHLKHARHELGDRDFRLVRDILADRQTIARATVLRSGEGRLTGKLTAKHVGYQFREALDALGTMFGFQGEAPRRRPIRDELSELANNATNPKLHAAMRLAKDLAA